MVQPQRPLLDQLLGLRLDQPGLPVEEPLGRAGDGGVVLGMVGGQGGRIGVGANAGLADRRFRGFPFAAEQAFEEIFRHGSIPQPDVTSQGQFCPSAAHGGQTHSPAQSLRGRLIRRQIVRK